MHRSAHKLGSDTSGISTHAFNTELTIIPIVTHERCRQNWTVKFNINLFSDIDKVEVTFSDKYTRRERILNNNDILERVLNIGLNQSVCASDLERAVTHTTSLNEVTHNGEDEPIGTLHYGPYTTTNMQQHIPVGGYTNDVYQSITGYERNTIMHSNTIEDTESTTCSIGHHYDTLGYIVLDQKYMLLFVSVILAGYNTHWLITCVDGEHIPLHDAVVLSLENDNLYHKDNTQHECGIDRSMYKCENIGIVTGIGNILKCNDGPKKSDGRGVSTGRSKRYASNLVGLKRYLALVGIKGTTSRIAHNSLI